MALPGDSAFPFEQILRASSQEATENFLGRISLALMGLHGEEHSTVRLNQREKQVIRSLHLVWRDKTRAEMKVANLPVVEHQVRERVLLALAYPVAQPR